LTKTIMAQMRHYLVEILLEPYWLQS
jgi:hypothetical protein